MSGDLPLSATELSGFSECQHLTWLNAGVARGERELPGRNELERWMLEHRGRAHEARLLDWYRRQGKQVVELSPAPVRDEAALARAVEATWAALEQGAEVVYQGTLRHEGWTGRPDFLMQVPGKSRLGSFHYEVLDAKLARHAQARSILQLCVYTEQLGALQGRLPERFWVAIGGSSPSGSSDDGLAPLPPIECRTHDYLAYYRRTRGRFERFVAEAERVAEPYPEPVEHCDVCRWWKHCESRRRADDHVSLVAGSTRRQRDRLARVGVATATQLAQLAPAQAVTGIDAAPLERLREQARLQLAGREAGRVLHELLLGGEPGTGLERLPLPTPGDLFLDLEGDAYALGDGLEYLFGLVELGEPSLGWSSRTEPGPPRYLAHWAQNRAEEKRAFEAVIRRIEHGLLEFPGLHVFHFGQRESDALRRLSCRHASMELQVDRLLREHVLVDLHTVVKQSLRASVESYTLKQLEGLYGFTRALEPRRAALSMQRYGFWLETGEALSDLEEERRVLERYNAEDCHSAWQLRGWLEQRRTERELSEGRPLNRPSAAAAEQQQESRKERSKDATLAVEQLQTGLPEDAAQDTPEQRGKRVLGHLVGWHWREQKSAWWEYYRATELAHSERLEDRAVLDGLEFEKIAGKVARSQLFRYRFPEQEHPRRGPWRDPDSNKNVDVVALGASHVDIKRGAKLAKEAHPRSLIPTPIDSAAQEKSVLSIAQSVARHGLSGTKRGVEAFPAARALLLRQPPRCGQAEGAPLLPEAADTVSGVVSLVLALEPGVLAVQGPPGSGKTHRAAAAIVALLRAGKRVGITANSHQVITDLLGKCCARARAEGLAVGAHHIDKVTEPLVREGEADAARVLAEELLAEKEAELYSEHDDHEAVAAGLRDGSLQLVGATSYAWARELYQGSLDVLVVDEAAQISLANVIAVSPAAPRLILFGDPAQLEQPQRGVHPPGADVSALEYLLGDALTMPAALGVFLAETRRLHPELCKFTSQVFYEGRLHALPGLEQQRIVHVGASELRLTGLAGSGLRFVPTPHRGNTHRSEEEVQQVAQLVKELLGGGYRFVTAEGVERTLEPRDVLVVAPYNAQVAALRQSLPANVAVGTVDKFQGREAPVVIYSLTSSSAADAPRGFEFLYSLNRLNVATSRAQALVILVASPELAQAHCRSPRQMQLVNALCTFLELVSGLAE